MSREYNIRDPLHGDIKHTGLLKDLVQSYPVQRLDGIRQLGLTYKIFPGATHTRFAHVNGACNHARRLLARQDIQSIVPPRDRLLIQAAALLHDIGHPPFSHALEMLYPRDHEQMGQQIIRGQLDLPYGDGGEVRRALERWEVDPEEIVGLLEGGARPAFYHDLISSPVIDVDRMDYLMRDTYFSGASIGTIDAGRLLGNLVVEPSTGRLGLREKAVASLEQFFEARRHMYGQVYLHPSSYLGEQILGLAVQDSPQLLDMGTDDRLLARLHAQGSDFSRRMVGLLDRGKKAFPREALEIRTEGIHADRCEKAFALAAVERERPGRAAGAIRAATGLDRGDVVVTFPGGPPAGESAKLPPFPIELKDGSWVDLFEHFEVARMLYRTRQSRTVMGVYTWPEHIARVRGAALELLDTDFGSQD